jgi:tRNA A-37 threonylcarbamoyl transferase component Bud32
MSSGRGSKLARKIVPRANRTSGNPIAAHPEGKNFAESSKGGLPFCARRHHILGAGYQMIGDALGNYRLVAQLGSGSMGVVFLAEHQRIERRVAIKLLAPELVRDQQALGRFFNEARATSLTRHPGIVEVFDCDVDATGRAYMVMEHLEGETLAERLRRAGKLHWSAASLIARRVAGALAAVHDKGIVHRDLKPENLFLVANGRDPTAGVKVLDFGVAKLLTADAVARLTMRGVLLGTPTYMSPEQCAGAEVVDHRADIYALGCILFEMLTGQPPFVTSSVREMVFAHRFRSAPSPVASCADVPEWLRNLLARMLAKEPDRRPASMHEVSKALCEYKARRRTTAKATVPAAKQGGDREATRVLRGRAATLVRQLRKRRNEATIVLAALFVMVSAAWALHRNAAVVPRSGNSAPTMVTAETPPRPPARAPALTNTVLKAGADMLPAPAKPTQTGHPTSGSGGQVFPLPTVRKPPPAARSGGPGRPAPIERRVIDGDGIVDL